MTNILDGMALVNGVILEEAKCEYKPEDTSWKANVDGKSSVLAAFLGDKPNASSEAELSNSKWPSQAHHLITHKTLKAHPLTKWLKKDGGFLFADTYYNVDHKNNGKWMPYASVLKEWKTRATKTKDIEKNIELMYKVMALSQIQLHQGRHSSSKTYGIGKWPYKARVKQYLDKIKTNALSHYAGTERCQECKSKKQDSKYPPRANMVRYVDQASDKIERDINANRIFVSKIAAEFTKSRGFL